jgi:hypothetical protein
MNARIVRELTLRRVVGWLGGAEDFSNVSYFVTFVGHPRSGHSLVGSLLNAHPDAVIAHEAGAFRLVRWHYSRRALFGTLLQTDRRFTGQGSTWTGYDYSVPGQWQGRYRRLKVIGDKKGGQSAFEISRDPTILERLRSVVRVPTRFILVSRHPMDNIARMATREQSGVSHAIDSYRRMCDGIAVVYDQADAIAITHESFVAAPRDILARLCRWLDLDEDSDFLDAAAAIVNDSPRLARDAVLWNDADLDQVRSLVRNYSFLSSYDV